MKRIVLAFMLAASLASLAGALEVVKPKIDHGILDLRNHDFLKDGPVSLDGAWEFYPGKLLVDPDIAVPASQYAMVPGDWSRNTGADGRPMGHGYGTYRLRIRPPAGGQMLGIKLPGEGRAFKVFVDGKLLAKSGRVSPDKDIHESSDSPATAYFIPAADECSLVVQVSNFSHARGGFIYPAVIGIPAQISAQDANPVALNVLLVGVLLLAFLYHLVMYLFRRRDDSSLYFALFCIVMIPYLLGEGERLVNYPVGFIPWELQHKFDFIPLCLGIPVIVLYADSLFRKAMSRTFMVATFICAAAFAAWVIAFPTVVNSFATPYLDILLSASVVAMIVIIARAPGIDRSDASLFLVGLVLLAATAVNDMLLRNLVIRSWILAPAGLLVFVCLQSLLLARRYSSSCRTAETLADSYRRFVPDRFLELLGKPTVAGVGPGDHAACELAVLSCAIREFPSLAGELTPEQTVDFVNASLKGVAPIVERCGGTIERYSGAGFVALFSRGCGESLRAAREIGALVKKGNAKRKVEGQAALSVGIGLHAGTALLAVMGESERLGFSVVSEVVDTASAIRGLAGTLDAPVIASGDFLSRIEGERPQARLLGKVRAGGKLVDIHELFGDGDDDGRRKTRGLFETALEEYFGRRFEEAAGTFEAVLKQDGGDRAARFYLARAGECRLRGVDQSWTGAVSDS